MWNMETLDLSSKSTPTRSLANAVGLITPESPDGSKPVNLDLKHVKTEYNVSPENQPRTTLFRPWDDSPESLSPPQSEDISPASLHVTDTSVTSSVKHESPTSETLRQPHFHQLVSPVFDSWTGSDFSLYSSPYSYVTSTHVLRSPFLPFPPVQRTDYSIQQYAHYNPLSFVPPTSSAAVLQSQQTSISPVCTESPCTPYSKPQRADQPRLYKRKRTDEQDGSPLLFKQMKADDRVAGVRQLNAGNMVAGTSARVPCGVCEAPSTGYHYGAHVCEGCKGFFRRRVLRRDLDSFVCGKGDLCKMVGRNRIHCKLCRWRKCLMIGMNPSAIRTERRQQKEPTSFTNSILSVHQDTMIAVPALYLGREHAKNMPNLLAASLPSHADLSTESFGCSLQFVLNLPGFADASAGQAKYMTGSGVLQVMLARFLSRYRPDVNAFLFPSGEFVHPAQLDLPDSVKASLTMLAGEMACQGLTDLDLACLCTLACCNPEDPPVLYDRVLENLTTSSSTAVLALLLNLQELFRCDPHGWADLKLTHTS